MLEGGFLGKTYIAEQLSFRVLGKIFLERWLRGSGHSVDLPKSNAENIYANVISSLNGIFPGVHDKQKLVAQCYDGVSVLIGQDRGVQSIVKEAYPNAHYVHCYAHQLNLVLLQATSQIHCVRVLFAHLNELSSFTLQREYHTLTTLFP